MLKLTDASKSKNKLEEFYKLGITDIFKVGDHVYIKIKDSHVENNALNLNKGFVKTLKPDDIVEMPIKAELIYEF